MTAQDSQQRSSVIAAIAVIVAVVGILVILGAIALGVLVPMIGSLAGTPTRVPLRVERPVANQITDVPTVTSPPTNTPTHTPTNTPTSTPTITPTNTPTETPFPPTATPVPPTATKAPAKAAAVPGAAPAGPGRCIAVVGDSVAHGDAVYEIPGVGYVQANFAPVSAFLSFQYAGKQVQVRNRSASAVGLSSSNHPSYFNTVEYASLLQDGCQYVVIVPWLNDLSGGVDGSVAAPNHVAQLAALSRSLISRNANVKVLILSYYQGVPAPFALSSFASGFTPGNIAAFNQQIAAGCAGGVLALPQVSCVNIDNALGGLGGAHLIGSATRQDFESMLIAPVSPDQQNSLNFYFSNNPNGSLVGDGVHLSNTGKARLATYLATLMP